MGIAYTKLPIVYNPVVRSNTSSNIRADIDAALLSAGWVHIRALTKGFVYKCGSPQNLVARLRIQDTGSTGNTLPCIEVQFMSDDETQLGFLHKLLCNAGVPNYQILAGCCYLFISTPGVPTLTTDSSGAGRFFNSVCGGIPFLPFNVTGDCAADSIGPLLVSQMWWSSGPPGAPSENFRTSRFSVKGTYSFCRDTNLFIPAGDGGSLVSGALNLGPLEPTAFVDQALSHHPQTLTYSTRNPIDVEPLLLHGYQIQGQLWDAFMRTKLINPVDTIVTTTETNGTNSFLATWMSYNRTTSTIPVGQQDGQGTYFATLFLLQGLNQTTSEEESNYAY